jgi:cysteine synthase A
MTHVGCHRSELPTLLGAIGRTPLVRLQRVTPPGVDILAKVEWYGPTDRSRTASTPTCSPRPRSAARSSRDDDHRVHDGQRRDRLLGGGGDQGYRCVIVMPEGMSSERKTMIKAYGADLVLTPGAGTDIDLAIAGCVRSSPTTPIGTSSPGSSRTPTTRSPAASAWRSGRQSGGASTPSWVPRGPADGSAAWPRALKRHNPDVRAFAVEPRNAR